MLSPKSLENSAELSLLSASHKAQLLLLQLLQLEYQLVLQLEKRNRQRLQ